VEVARLTNEHTQVTRGQIFAFALVFVAIFAGAIVAVMNPTWTGSLAGSALGVGGMGSIVAIFITRRHAHASQSRERSKKQDADKSSD